MKIRLKVMIFLGRKRAIFGDILDAHGGSMELLIRDRKGKPNGCFMRLSGHIFILTPKGESCTYPLNTTKVFLCGQMAILVKTDFNIPEEHHKFGTHIKVSQGGTVRQTGVMMTYEGYNAKYLLFDCILNFTLNHN